MFQTYHATWFLLNGLSPNYKSNIKSHLSTSFHMVASYLLTLTSFLSSTTWHPTFLFLPYFTKQPHQTCPFLASCKPPTLKKPNYSTALWPTTNHSPLLFLSELPSSLTTSLLNNASSITGTLDSTLWIFPPSKVWPIKTLGYLKN